MNGYQIAAVLLIVFLVAVFFITFVLNKHTPVPKGCEHLKIEEGNCMGCSNSDCKIKQDFDLKKIEEEIKEK